MSSYCCVCVLILLLSAVCAGLKDELQESEDATVKDVNGADSAAAKLAECLEVQGAQLTAEVEDLENENETARSLLTVSSQNNATLKTHPPTHSLSRARTLSLTLSHSHKKYHAHTHNVVL